MNWREYPGLRIGICFILGIALGNWVSLSVSFLLVASLFLLIYILKADNVNILEDSVVQRVSLLLLVLALFAGLMRSELQKNEADTYHYGRYLTDSIQTTVAVVIEDVKKKSTLKTTVDVKSIDNINVRGKLLIYFPKSDSSEIIAPGDVLVFKSKIHNTKINSNPDAFDYKAYLKNRGVSYQTYLREGQFYKARSGELSPTLSVTLKLRNRALEVLEEKLDTKEQLATASAMILGYRDHISEELYTAYATTGSVHVLAVSGLHVGIICWVFIALFKRIKSEHLAVKIFKALSLILLVWFYAILTGAAPAVVRAAVMFSVVIIGRYWFDFQNIYNTLILSAILLLMYNPFLLFQASFQFSYLALTGIVFFHKLWFNKFESRYNVVNYIWNLLVVAVAAQTLVFPVTVYFFHKFPLYFPISGLFSVMLAFCILINGIVVILFSWVPILGDIITYTFKFFLDSFIQIVYFISDLPYSNLSGLWLSVQSTVLIYIGIILLMYLIHNQKKVKVLYGIGLVVLGLIYNNYSFNSSTLKQQSLLLYEVSGASLLDVFRGKTCYSMSSDSMSKSKIIFAADNYRISSKIKNVQPLSSLNPKDDITKHGVLQYRDKLIFIPGMSPDMDNIPVDSDYLFLTNSYDYWPSRLVYSHKTKCLVIDKSIEWRKRKAWLKYADEKCIEVHDLRTDGAFFLN